MLVGSAEVLIHANTSGFKRELEAGSAPGLRSLEKDSAIAGETSGLSIRSGVSKHTSQLEGDLRKHGQAAGAGLSSGMASGLNKVMLGLAAAGLGVAAFGIHAAEGMQTAEAAIAAASGTSVASAQKIGSAFLDTAGKSEFSGKQIATAFAGVAGQLKATEGHALSAKEALQVMSAAGDLATAKQIDLGVATSATAGIMQAFKLQTADAGHATDVLYQTSVATGQGVDTLSTQLERVRSKLGETAGSVGALAGLMVDMTDQGITGRAALAALNGTMNSLLKPSKDAKLATKELGLQVFDNTGKFVGLGSVIDQLHPKFQKMTQEQQLHAATELFGAAAGRQMLAVINAGPSAYDKATAAVNRHGAAQSAAAKQSRTLHVEEQTLKAEVADLAAKIGAVLIPILTALVGGLTKATSFVLSHKAALIALAAVVTGILGPAIAVFAINKMAQFTNSFTQATGHVKQFASDVESVVSRVISAFTKQNVAAKTMGDTTVAQTARAGAASGTQATETTAASTTIEAENTAAGGSFAAEATAAGTATAAVDAAVGVEAGAVTAADTAIEGENAAAGASFAAVLGPLAALGVGAVGLGYVLNKYGTPPGKAHYRSAATGQQVYNPRVGSQTIHFGPGGETTAAGPVNLPVPGLGGPSGPTFKGSASGHAAGGGDITSTLGVPPTAQAKAIIAAAARKYGISPALLWGVYGTETTYGTNVTTSSAGAVGPFQLEPGTARTLGVNPYNFASAAQGAAKYLSEFSGRGVAGMLSAYNAGPAGGMQPGYVASVLKDARTFGGAVAVHVQSIAPEYVNPLGRARATVERTDQGKDWGNIIGPISAIGQGVIKKVYANLQGFGQTVIEQLTSGARKGQEIYYAMETGARASVRAGQHVGTGQAVGQGLGTGGVELGFWDPATGRSAGAPGFTGANATAGGRAFASFVGGLPANVSAAAGTFDPQSAAQVAAQTLASERAQLAKVIAQETAATNRRIASERASVSGKGHTPAEKAMVAQEIADQKAGLSLQVAAQKAALGELTAKQSAELKKQTADAKAGSAQFVKLTGAIHTGGVKALENALTQAHTAGLSRIERNLDHDHNAALRELSKELVAVHRQAMAALVKATAQAAADAAAKAETTLLGSESTDVARAAADQARSIAAGTKIWLDQQAEAGQTGAALIAAQAQTALDELTANMDNAISAAQAKVDADTAAGASALTLAQDNYALAQVQAAATVQEAQAQSTLDRASQAANAASAPGAPAGPAAPATFNFEIYGNGTLTAAQLFSEAAWALSTGALPVAPAPVGS